VFFHWVLVHRKAGYWPVHRWKIQLLRPLCARARKRSCTQCSQYKFTESLLVYARFLFFSLIHKNFQDEEQRSRYVSITGQWFSMPRGPFVHVNQFLLTLLLRLFPRRNFCGLVEQVRTQARCPSSRPLNTLTASTLTTENHSPASSFAGPTPDSDGEKAAVRLCAASRLMCSGLCSPVRQHIRFWLNFSHRLK